MVYIVNTNGYGSVLLDTTAVVRGKERGPECHRYKVGDKQRTRNTYEVLILLVM